MNFPAVWVGYHSADCRSHFFALPSKRHAERWRRGFEQCGELLSENMIMAGRFVCLNCMNRYRLRTGIFHCGATVARGKTLPARRLGHIEIVLPGDPETLNARALAFFLMKDSACRGSQLKPVRQKGA